MNESETSTRCLFSSYLKISYDQHFISAAQDMVNNLARLSGANETEAYQLTMLVEESLAFIIGKYIDDKFKAHIEIGYLLFDDGKIILEFSDMGSPIHQEKIPEFNLQDPDTADGLWYHMVRKMADRFEFINQLSQGWLIRIEKTIAQPGFVSAGLPELEAAASGQLTVRRATTDDAAALVDLAFMTYRYSYNVVQFYDAEVLRTHIAAGHYDILVVVDGPRIVAAAALKYSAAAPNSAELGSAMVHPDYRKTRALFHLIRAIGEYHVENPRQVDFFFTLLITTHNRSQKAVERVHRGYKPLSILPNFVTRSNYVGIKEIAGTRESLLQAYHLNGGLEVATVYAPPCHAGMVRELIEHTDTFPTVSTEAAAPVAAQTDLSSQVFEVFESANVTVETIGADWLTKLCGTLLTLTASGCRAIVVSLPTHTPLPFGLDEKMTDLNLFFCGLGLRSLGEVGLNYAFTSEPVDFRLIELHSPIAKNLLAHIEKDYRHPGSDHASLAAVSPTAID